MHWQLQEAKNKLSEVIKKAQSSGPQVITLRGKEAVVVLSAEDFQKLTKKKDTFVSFLKRSPLATVELDLDRSKEVGRKLDL